MKCLRCEEEKKLKVIYIAKELTPIGFCDECWEEVDKSGKCIRCGVEEDLFIQAMWGGKVIEHICGYCRDTTNYGVTISKGLLTEIR